MSDLHLELAEPPQIRDVDFDVVVLAGDIAAPGRRAVEWARSVFEVKPVILVPGNHEFYGSGVERELAAMRQTAACGTVHVMSRDSLVIDGVRFLGALLWTDFAFPVRNQTDASMTSDVGRALTAAGEVMNDYRRIRFDAASAEPPGWNKGRLLRPADTLRMHRVDRRWLQEQLAKPFNGPTVVITHHAPSSGSVAERYVADWVTPAFASDLPAEFFESADVWIHGHTHTAFDYRRDSRCRVISNPRGYRMKDGSFENTQFDAGYVVEV